ncbi:MAG: hypothetical protein V4722_26180 [Bacteroidota bacterium]
MKKITLVSLFFNLYFIGRSQNVGIGTTNPTKARLEVFGAVAGGTTSAIFGSDGAGISLQRNVPSVGFNLYNPSVTKYMANGSAVLQLFDPSSGVMHFDLYPVGTANANAPAGLRTLSLYNTGQVSIRGAAPDGTLTVARGTATGGTALFWGTANASHFNYDDDETTYIRAGKNGSDVVLNDIAAGNVHIGNGNAKLGINILPDAPATALDINGAVTLRPAITTISAGFTVVNVGDRSYIDLTRGFPAGLGNELSITLSNGLRNGQVLILAGDESNGSSGPKLFNDAGGNVKLDDGQVFTFRANHTMMLLWTGTRWIEVSRSLNRV